MIAIFLLFISIPDRRVINAEKQTLLSTLTKMDLVGFSIFAPAAIQLILALQWGGVRYSWSSATIIGLFCGSFGTLLIFLAWENHMGKEAMIPLSIIRRRVIWSSCMNMGCIMGGLLPSTYYLPIYFQAVRDATPSLSGVDLLPSMLSTILFGIASGILGMSNILAWNNLRRQLLNIISGAGRVLPPFRSGQRHPHNHRFRPSHDSHSQYRSWSLDRISDHPGSWTRHGHSNANRSRPEQLF